jgi:hypothetical protein
VKAPDPLNDLYADLRARRLLPIVGILIAALVAVPLLLGGGGEPTPATPAISGATATADLKAAEELEPVVLADVPGLRRYQKRLDSFQSRNPFKQQYQSAPAGSEESDSESDSGSGDVTTNPPASPSGGGSPGAGGADGGTPGGTPGGGGDGGSGGGGKVVEEYRISWKIDVKVGVVGDTEKKKDVKQFSFLPGVKRPVVQFITGAKNEAFFVVSRNVGKTEGDGACAPNNKACSFLLLKKGEEHRFVYQPDGRTYRLKLTKVTRVKKKIDGTGASTRAEQAFEKLQGRVGGE